MNDEIKKRKKKKPTEKIIFSTRVTKKFDYTFRLEALKKKLTMEELLELYQHAYHEKHEREKAERSKKEK
jgi:hypothetical protein